MADNLSETRFLKNQPNTTNFALPGYSTEHTPTESSAGGALLYISNRFSYLIRNDLNQCMYKSKSLESIFVEINFTKKVNIIVGSVYRHPGMSIEEFNSDFLSPFL